MYVPPAFRVDDDAAWSIVRDAGAGFLVAAAGEDVVSVLAPVVIAEDRRTLVSHVARANPWWRSVAPDTPVLALFLAASAYVSPTYYPSRVEQRGVVPTWDYVAAEVRGTARIHEDAPWLRGQVTALTDRFEAGRDPRWWVEDAPEEYLERQLRAIVGVEVLVSSISASSKLSQNRPEADQSSVARELGARSLAERVVAARMRA